MKWVLRLVGALVVAALLLVGLLFLLPKDRIARIALDQIEDRIGRAVRIDGDVSLSVWPVLGVETGPVVMANAEWAGPEPMLTARAMSLGVDTSALWRGALQVRHVVIEDPVVRLAARADGSANWIFGSAAPASPADARPQPTGSAEVTIERLSVRNARFIYSAPDAPEVSVTRVGADLAWPRADAPAQLSGQFDLAGALIEIESQIADPVAFLAGAISQVSARLAAPGGSLGFDGRASTAAEAAGRLVLTAEDTQRFLAAFGVATGALTQGQGKSLQIATDLTLTRDARVSLRDLSMASGANRATGAADIALGAVPRVTAQLTAGRLDLTTPAGSGAAPAAAGAEGWSTQPIDAGALALADGSITLSAEAIATDAADLGPTRAVLTLDRSRAVLTIAEAAVFGGNLSGELVANNRNGLSVGGDLRAQGVEMQTLLNRFAGTDRVSGKADAELRFLGVGNSEDAIMRSLSGGGQIAIGRGVFSGIDLDRLMRSGETGDGTTVFDALTASFTLSEGVARNSDLALLLANYRAEGSGRIGLGARDLDYLFTPIALRARSGQGVAIPVRIAGPWSAPRFYPDLSEALKLNADGKVEEIREEVREKVEQKLLDELDTTRTDGKSLEDTVKDALEQKARDGLLRLLGND
ncbi:MAG: AsmA family protein [Rhodobacteraceae bacterium]|nr:AsmA family protein [Paracoccaceae bacterium]